VGRRLRDGLAMLATGYRIDARLTTEMLLATVGYHLTQTLRALWLKLLVEVILRGQVDTATTWAVVLAVNDVVRTTAIVRTQMAKRDLEDKARQHFEAEAMRLAGTQRSIAHYERQDYLDRLDGFRTALPALAGGLGSVSDGITMAIRIGFILFLLVGVHPALGLLPLFALPSLLTSRAAQRAVHRGEQAVATPTRLGDHLWAVATQPAPAKETLVRGLHPELRARTRDAWRTASQREVAATARSTGWNLLGWLVYATGYAGSVLFAVTAAADGRATPGDVFLVAVLAAQVNVVVQEAVTLVGTLTTVFHALDLRRWLLAPAGADRGRLGGDRPVPDVLQDGITLEAVTFAYSPTDSPALQDVSVHLPAGSTVAVVGENGAGKTTLVKLVCGFYPLDRGRILVDGVDLAELDLEAWRRRLTASFQDFVRFELTLGQAVGIGDLPALEDPTAIRRALTEADATEMADRLPAGLDTQLGPTFGGVDLSGGEWQKLAVARASLRSDPLLLVLDEPTAALDAAAEAALFGRYAAAARRASNTVRGITVLVSHRFSTVRSADLILVLDQGRLVEAGTHRDLVARDGLYAELYALQAAAYR
jgi:ATP-binding cassette subfamily B protein